MKKYTLFFWLWMLFWALLLPRSVTAASLTPGGTRPAGMANAMVAVYDFWALCHNQAGMARIRSPAAAFHAENRYMIPELSQAAAGYVHPAGEGTMGVTLNWFGNALYNEGTAGLAYARLFGDKLAAGVMLSYRFISIGEGFGSAGTIAAEIGLICEILPGLRVGAHIDNPGRARIATYEYLDHDERLPSVIRSGLAYQFSEGLQASLEVEKDIHYPARARIGVEYAYGERIMLRTGLTTHPMTNSFGFGLKSGNWQLDLASSYHYVLGYSPQAGLLYQW